MRRSCLAISMAMVVISTSCFAQETALTESVISSVKKATVFIQVRGKDWKGTGTGFVISSSKDKVLVATNYHVVAEMDRIGLKSPSDFLREAKSSEITVTFDSGLRTERSIKADALAVDPENDLAILKLTNVKDPPTAIEYASPPKLVETMQVFSFGYPFGQALANGRSPTVTVGKASISNLRTGPDGELSMIQIDGSLNPGNSGGPMVDAKGRLIGVAVSIIKDGQGIGFAIPAQDIARMVRGRLDGLHTTKTKAADGQWTLNVEVGVIDTAESITGVTLHYAPIAANAVKPNRNGILSKQLTVRKLELKLADGVAKGQLIVDPKDGDVVLQAVPTGGPGVQGATEVRKISLNKAVLTNIQPALNAKPPVGLSEYATADKAFTVWIPEKNQQKSQNEKVSPIEQTDMRITSLRVETLDGVNYSLLRLTFPVQVLNTADRDEVIDSFRDRILDGTQGTVEEENEVKIENATGKDFLINTRGGVALRTRMMVASGGRLFILLASGPSEKVDHQDALAVFNSCRIPADAPPPVIAKNPVGKGPNQISGILGRGPFGPGGPGGPYGPGGPFSTGPAAKDFPGGPEGKGPFRTFPKGPVSKGPYNPPSKIDPEMTRPNTGTGTAVPRIATGIQGGNSDPTFQDVAPEGAILVGYEVGMGKWNNLNEVINALRPIYRDGSTEILGKQYGPAPAKPIRVVAKPGYAVGSLTITAAAMVDSFTVTFMKIGTGRLIPTDSYESEKVGGPKGEFTAKVGGDGTFAVGLIGRTNAKNEVTGMGLYFPVPKIPSGEATIQGSLHDPITRQQAPSKSLLVGFEFGYAKFGTHDVVKGVRPIFRSGTTETQGELTGVSSVNPSKTVAKPGYAVGAINIRAVNFVVGLSVTYMKVLDGKLDPKDTYESEWFGSKIFSEPKTIGGDGSQIIGVHLRVRNNEVTGIGLMSVSERLPHGAVLSKPVGHPNDKQFYEVGPEGSLLVGVEAGTEMWGTYNVVRTIKPIFRNGTKDTTGQLVGVERPTVVKVIAKPGYAVGALNVKAVLGVFGFSLTFMKVVDGKLDPKDSYESEWIGSKNDKRPPTQVAGTGETVFGFVLRANPNEVTAMGLITQPKK